MNDHCTREEILSGARRGRLGSKAAREHTDRCDECRRLWDLAVLFVRSSPDTLLRAPTGWVEQAVALAQSNRDVTRSIRLVAHLIFDSWTAPAAVGLRGQKAHDTRRLSWEAGDWQLELRAEAVPGGWEFVAQVHHLDAPRPGVQLEMGRTRVHTDRSGMAAWSSPRPPRRLNVQADDTHLELELVSWDPPKP